MTYYGCKGGRARTYSGTHAPRTFGLVIMKKMRKGEEKNVRQQAKCVSPRLSLYPDCVYPKKALAKTVLHTRRDTRIEKATEREESPPLPLWIVGLKTPDK